MSNAAARTVYWQSYCFAERNSASWRYRDVCARNREGSRCIPNRKDPDLDSAPAFRDLAPPLGDHVAEPLRGRARHVIASRRTSAIATLARVASRFARHGVAAELPRSTPLRMWIRRRVDQVTVAIGRLSNSLLQRFSASADLTFRCKRSLRRHSCCASYLKRLCRGCRSLGSRLLRRSPPTHGGPEGGGPRPSPALCVAFTSQRPSCRYRRSLLLLLSVIVAEQQGVPLVGT